MRVLLLTPYHPDEPHAHAAGDLAARLVSQLARHVEVLVYSPGSAGVGVPGRPWSSLPSTAPTSTGPARLVGVRPAWLRKEWSRRASAEVRQIVAEVRPDVVHAEYLQAAEPLLGLDSPCTVTLHDVTQEVTRGLLSAARGPVRAHRLLEHERTKRFEDAVLRDVDHAFLLSPDDRDLVSARTSSASVVRVGVDPPRAQWSADEAEDGLVVFSGAMWRTANEGAALWLAQAVMPAVWACRPSARLAIVGAGPTTRVQRLATDRRILVTGRVDDLDAWNSRAAVVVTPSLVRGGVLLKLLKALAAGCPVVTTPGPAASAGVVDGRSALVARDSESFAAAVLRLLDDAELGGRLGEQGRRLVRESFSWEAVAQPYLTAWNRLGAAA